MVEKYTQSQKLKVYLVDNYKNNTYMKHNEDMYFYIFILNFNNGILCFVSITTPSNFNHDIKH